MNKTEQALEILKQQVRIENDFADGRMTRRAADAALAALSQSEAPAEQPEDERLAFAIIGHLGPAALAGDKMSVYDAFKLGWQAAKRDARAQAPQERAAVTDREILDAADVWGMDMGDVYEFSEKKLIEMVRALLSLASSEGKP